MAIKVNGTTLDWECYEFGVKFASGKVHICDSKEDADATAEHLHGKTVFRALYVTPWTETL